MNNESSYESRYESVDYETEDLRLNQNFALGVLGGLIGAILGAIIWATISVITDYQIGWMAIGVGFLVGKSVSYLGRGVDFHFRIIGTIFSVVGCLLGNLLTVLIIISNVEGIAFFELLQFLDLQIIIGIIQDTFAPMDIFFYALAVYEGYRFSIKIIKKNKNQVLESSENQI